MRRPTNEGRLGDRRAAAQELELEVVAEGLLSPEPFDPPDPAEPLVPPDPPELLVDSLDDVVDEPSDDDEPEPDRLLVPERLSVL